MQPQNPTVMRSADKGDDRLLSLTPTTMHPSKLSTKALVIDNEFWITSAKTVEAVAVESRTMDNLEKDLSKLKM